MLYEKITYDDDFPIHITIANIQEYPLHYHQDIEFVYVLRGEIKLRNGYCSYLLKEGDIFTNSGHEVHSLTATDKENVVAVIQISNRFFTRYFPSLTKNCFRTYVNRDPYLQLDALRKMLLQIMLDYLRKSFNYQNQCTFMMIDVIKYLNQHFNLFAFEDQVVVNFKDDNPVVVERISRIISYIYENYPDKITLEKLAQREHLSTYYLSHLIRQYVGISFQEFLCFARVEMSEIPLLQTNKKISSVARDVGFSTTAYYEKYFKKWFGASPQADRAQFQPLILSASHPAKRNMLSESVAINLIKRCLSAINSQDINSITINQQQFNILVDPEKAPLLKLNHHLKVGVTPEDAQYMGDRMFCLLQAMDPSEVFIISSKEDRADELNRLRRRLESRNFCVAPISEHPLDLTPAFGYDSFAAFIHIFKAHFLSKEEPVLCRLRDQGDPQIVLKGLPCCFTSNQVAKPSFYAYLLLQIINGNLLHWNKYYSVLKTRLDGTDAYILMGFNYSDEMERLCVQGAGIHEVNDVLNNFMDEITLDFDLPLKPGKYSVLKFSFSDKNTIFRYMAQLGFPKYTPFSRDWLQFLNTQPSIQGLLETVTDDSLSVSFHMRGPAAQIAVIRPTQGEE